MAEPAHVGRSEDFRSRGWLERAVARLRGGRRGRAPASLRRIHEMLLGVMTPGALRAQLPHGERVRLSARYRHLSWNPLEYEAFRAAVTPGAVVFDVGANVGAYTVLFAQWAGESGRVVAFEPGPDARNGLQRHLRLNGLTRVEVVDAAVAAVDANRGRLYVDAAGGATSLLSTDGIVPVDVRTVTLDGFCASRNLWPDVVKIDVEGAELDVLRGARQVLSRSGAHVFIEFHPTVWRVHGIAAADIEREIARLGFAAQPLDAAYDVWKTEGVCARLVRH